jgi:hypothetical protein
MGMNYNITHTLTLPNSNTLILYTTDSFETNIKCQGSNIHDRIQCTLTASQRSDTSRGFTLA